MRTSILALIIVILFNACNNDKPLNYVRLSGKIVNPNSDSIYIKFPTGSEKMIKKINVNSDGTFSDTLEIKPNKYKISDGSNTAYIYLKNGYNLSITLDAQEFYKTLNYEGFGSNENNYLAKKKLLRLPMIYNPDDRIVIDFDETFFKKETEIISNKAKDLLHSYKPLDSLLLNMEEEFIKDLYLPFKEERKKIALLNSKFRGKDSPKFLDYISHEGKMMSLDDFKGKFVLIDFWTTWCGPCKYQFPFLKKMKDKYVNYNIEFVGVSIDKQNDKNKWKNMVLDNKDIVGIQLLATHGPNSKFFTDFVDNGVPRFILINPKGKVVHPYVPYPTDDKRFIRLLDEYLK